MTRPAVLAATNRTSADRTGAAIALLALAAVVAALAVVFGPLAAAPAAWAHDTLVSSTPADGETLDAAPSEATLSFSGEIQQVGTVFELRDSAGGAVGLPAAPELDGMTVTQPLPALAGGAYTLNWRVVSSDGHPIDGSIGFTVAGGAAADPTTAATPAAPGPSGLGGDQATSAPDQAVTTPAPVSEAGAGVPMWVIILIGLVGILVVVGVIIGFMGVMKRNDAMRRRAEGATPADGTTPADNGDTPSGGPGAGPVS